VLGARRANPIAAIHDIGAGGLSNAVPEIVDHSGCGATIELRAVPNDEPGMSPMELWCNESQERYMLTIEPADVPRFAAIAERERAPYAVIGELTANRELIVRDSSLGGTPVAMPMDVLFGKPPKMTRTATRTPFQAPTWRREQLSLASAVDRVLAFPAVADKSFLIHIGDRTVGGLCSRDQLVGPWQVPVSDVAVTAAGYEGYTGERSPWASARRSPFTTVRLRAARRRRGRAQYRGGRRRGVVGHSLVGELDGGRGARQRRLRALCDGARRRRGALPGARNCGARR
jgi:phosphoribosylformylglycinamidine synthase